MVSISLKTKKSFIAQPWCLLSVVGLEEYSAHDWRAATSVHRAPVTWRKWGLWSWHYYSDGGASSAELIALAVNKRDRKQTIIRTDKTDRIVSRTVWNILSWINRTKREWMEGIDFLNDAPLILRGLRPCQSPKQTFNEHLWVAPPAHPHCSSRNNPNLVLHRSRKAGVQRTLIWSRSVLVGVAS